jgi:dCMP deaminase
MAEQPQGMDSEREGEQHAIGGGNVSEQFDRPSWDDYFMEITFQVARRSTCPRAAVGAVIVRDKRILTTGYNGSPTHLPHCTEVGCLMVNGHCVRTLHAEQNAIIQGALHGVNVAGGTVYVTHQPCLVCAKMIINAGIVRVVYAGNYPDEIARGFLEGAGIELCKFTREGGTLPLECSEQPSEDP